MNLPSRRQLSDLRGATRLAVEATRGVTRVVETMHGTIQRLSPPVGRSAGKPPRGLTGFVYRTIDRGTRLVGWGLDAGFESVARCLPPGESSGEGSAELSAECDAYRAVLNGVCGDHLARTGNPLAIEMSLRFDGREINPRDPGRAFLETDEANEADEADEADETEPGGKILLLVHGLCRDDRHWLRDGHDHGASLAREFGHSPLYLRYNTGRSIAANGRDLAERLEDLVRRWPVDLEELVILGHSMGGLVARAACHHGEVAGHGWPRMLRKLIFLGTPHQGAPLERGGHRLERALGLSPYSAPLGRLVEARSAGIVDLRRGRVAADHSSVPLPRGVDCYAAAAVLAESEDRTLDGWIGDGLVPLDSALGQISPECRWVGYEMGHMDLLSRPEVYRQLRRWLDGAASPRHSASAGAGDDATRTRGTRFGRNG